MGKHEQAYPGIWSRPMRRVCEPRLVVMLAPGFSICIVTSITGDTVGWMEVQYRSGDDAFVFPLTYCTSSYNCLISALLVFRLPIFSRSVRFRSSILADVNHRGVEYIITVNVPELAFCVKRIVNIIICQCVYQLSRGTGQHLLSFQECTTLLRQRDNEGGLDGTSKSQKS